MIRRSLVFLLPFLVSISAGANVPNLDSLTDADLATVVEEFAANFVHTSATPPTSLGKVFGVEAAIIAGVTESAGVEAISKAVDPDADVPYIPHAWLLGGISVPYGVSIEVNILPELDVEGLEMNHYSVGLKWSVTDQFLENLPFDLAIRTYYTRSEISYRQNVSNASFPLTSEVDVSFENTMIGGDTLFGVDLAMIEPYAGFGFVNTKGTLAGSATTGTPYSLFDDGISREKTSNQDSMRIIAGALLKLTIMNIGIEYSRVFDTNRYSAKIGLRF